MRTDNDSLVPGSSSCIVGGMIEYGGSSFRRGGEDEFRLGHVAFETFISLAKGRIFQSEAQKRRRSETDIYLKYWCIETVHPRRA